MELKFHTASNIFYDNGVLKDEPENTLEKFMRRYARICNRYSRGIRRMVAEVRPYTRMQWIGYTEPTFIEVILLPQRHHP